MLVGVGQVTSRPDPAIPPSERPEPIDLMVRALRAAAEDTVGAPSGGSAPAGDHLLKRANSLRVVEMLGGRMSNPGLAVAERLGIEPVELMLSAIGGNMPQSILSQSARAIARGELDVVLVAGAECVYTRNAARKVRGASALDWVHQDPGTTPAPVAFGAERAPLTDLEMARGLSLPIHVYPLFENALRAANGWGLEEHRAHIGALWSSFSAVAAQNPYAWLRQHKTATEITEPGSDNRMVSFPYTKLCTANMMVDEGAAYILCSVEAARAAGVGEERWVFPLSGADAHDHWFISERENLATSPAIRLAGRAALDLAGVGIDDIGAIDLYSCFPCVVRIAAAELGLAVDDPGRPLTLTGGLTFFGGPGNNYTSHGIATLVGALRDAPGTVGMATGLGWFATKHAIGLYSSRPPTHQGHGFAWRDVQGEVDSTPRCTVDPDAHGPVTVETYTVTFSREGPERGILACRSESGARTWATVEDPSELASLTAAEGIGRSGTLGPDGVLHLN